MIFYCPFDDANGYTKNILFLIENVLVIHFWVLTQYLKTTDLGGL